MKNLCGCFIRFNYLFFNHVPDIIYLSVYSLIVGVIMFVPWLALGIVLGMAFVSFGISPGQMVLVLFTFVTVFLYIPIRLVFLRLAFKPSLQGLALLAANTDPVDIISAARKVRRLGWAYPVIDAIAYDHYTAYFFMKNRDYLAEFVAEYGNKIKQKESLDRLFLEGLTPENLDVCYSQHNIDRALETVKQNEEEEEERNERAKNPIKGSIAYWLEGDSSAPLFNTNHEEVVGYLVMVCPLICTFFTVFGICIVFPPALFVCIVISLRSRHSADMFFKKLILTPNKEGCRKVLFFTVFAMAFIGIMAVPMVDGLIIGIMLEYFN